MSSFEQVRYETSAGVATVTLHRPERLNAWTPIMERELRAAMDEAASDDAVRAIVLTGSGRGFCAGLDMDVLKGRESTDPPPPSRDTFGGRFTYFPSIEKPIVAAINGAAAGSGFVLALGCDLRFAASGAVFTTSFAQRGLTAEHGVAWMLPRLVGLSNAHDLLLSGRVVAADEALRLGLVNRVVPDAELLATSQAYARELAERCSPRSLRIIKRQIWDATFQSLPEVVAIADREMNASFASADFREGVAHFREKRAPRFGGR
jgi:enoyl-CoA hydratase/carnithine racemase